MATDERFAHLIDSHRAAFEKYKAAQLEFNKSVEVFNAKLDDLIMESEEID